MFIMINDDNKYNCADQAFIKRAGEYALENCGDMYLFAYSYLKNENEASNVVTTSIYHSMKNLRKTQAMPKLQNWFYQLLLRAIQKSLHQVDMKRNFTDNSQIYAYMETLPQNETGAFKLYHFAQMEISDISEILNSTDRKVVSAIENVSASLRISVKLDEASIKKLKELKRIYNEPEIPPELHDAVIAELKREEELFLRAKYKKERDRILKPFGLLLLFAVIMALTSLGMKQNPTFAEAVTQIPFAGKLLMLLQ